MRKAALSLWPWPGSESGVYCGGRVSQADAMTHLMEKESLLRVNTAAMLTLVWGGLAICALGAVIFDIGRAIAVW